MTKDKMNTEIEETVTGAGTATTKKLKALSVKIAATLTNNGNGSQTVNYIMSNPFPGEPLGDLRLTPVNPNKTDNFGRTVEDKLGESRKGLLDYHCKKALPSGGSLALNGSVTLKSYSNVEYVSIDIVNPAPEFLKTKEGPLATLRMFVKKTELQSVFDILCKERLEYVPAPETPAPVKKAPQYL